MKSVTPAAKPKSRNFKAEREARAKEQAERKQQDTVQKRDRKDTVMVTTEINDHKSEMNNEIKVLSVAITDQIEDVVHNPAAPKLISRAAALKAEQNAEYARGGEASLQTNKLQKQNKNVNSAGNG